MSRSFGIPLLLVTLLVGGYLFMQQAKTSGPASTTATQAEAQANGAAAATDFQAAAPVIQAYFADNGTYVGLTLPPTYNVAVVRADATSYCLQTGAGTAAEHEDGPAGGPLPGPC